MFASLFWASYVFEKGGFWEGEEGGLRVMCVCVVCCVCVLCVVCVCVCVCVCACSVFVLSRLLMSV